VAQPDGALRLMVTSTAALESPHPIGSCLCVAGTVAKSFMGPNYSPPPPVSFLAALCGRPRAARDQFHGRGIVSAGISPVVYRSR
jgi:hypothetical protein